LTTATLDRAATPSRNHPVPAAQAIAISESFPFGSADTEALADRPSANWIR